MMRNPRVIIGKRKGTKVRVRYPAMTSGYIQYTFASISEAKRHIKGLHHWQKNRAKLKEVI
jgi:hypothetical protein